MISSMSAENRNKMEEIHRDFISLSEAARITGYTSEHLNWLARQGKLQAKKLGRNWCTKMVWINEYLAAKKSAKAQKKGERTYFSEISQISETAEKAEITTRGRAYFIKKTLAPALVLALVFIIAVAVPIANYSLNKQKNLDAKFGSYNEPVFYDELQGMVKGEADTKNNDLFLTDTVLASENFLIKQFTFGGEIAVNADERKDIAIENIRSESFLNKKQDEAKVVLSWETNKLGASTIVFYDPGGTEKKKFSESTYGYNHGAIIPGFELGKTFHIKIKAQDRWGNKTESGLYAIYTGTRAVSVIELITKEFGQIFSWVPR